VAYHLWVRGVFSAAVFLVVSGVGCERSIEFLPEPVPAEQPPSSPRLQGAPISSDSDLPPIMGGTLLVTRDHQKAIAADPDRDLISVVDLERGEVDFQIELESGDLPGRSAQINPSRIATVLRGAGAIVLFDLERGEPRRIPVCVEPRGIAHDTDLDLTYVVCKSGELVTLRNDATNVIARRFVDLDLRDVWIVPGQLRITRFKTVEVLCTNKEGDILSREKAKGIFVEPQLHGFRPTVAWRAVPLPDGGGLIVHQRARTDPIALEKSGLEAFTSSGPPYGSNGWCEAGIVESTISFVSPSGTVRAGPTISGVLPVDIAVAPSGRIAIALAGSAENSPARVYDPSIITSSVRTCHGIQELVPTPGDNNEAVAIAFGRDEQVVAQWRDPSVLSIGARLVSLSKVRRRDTGHLVFHMATRAGIACASCHAEGGEDGHVWVFRPMGVRRTQSLEGGIVGTEPFHWNGDMDSFDVLADDVFSGRMGGQKLTPDQISALARFIDRLKIPVRPEPQDAATVLRGRAIFEREDVGCLSCHTTERFQTPGSHDVGTGEPLQVPSLRGIIYRAPYLHSGCASTLSERFGACGGGDAHGRTSQLTAQEISDLVQYLETL
jgi:mono/diheme cytochrome c family protein